MTLLQMFCFFGGLWRKWRIWCQIVINILITMYQKKFKKSKLPPPQECPKTSKKDPKESANKLGANTTSICNFCLQLIVIVALFWSTIDAGIHSTHPGAIKSIKNPIIFDVGNPDDPCTQNCQGNIEVGNREGNRKNNASTDQNHASAEEKQIGSAEHFQDSSDEQ